MNRALPDRFESDYRATRVESDYRATRLESDYRATRLESDYQRPPEGSGRKSRKNGFFQKCSESMPRASGGLGGLWGPLGGLWEALWAPLGPPWAPPGALGPWPLWALGVR